MAQFPPAAAPRNHRIGPDMGPAVFCNAPDSRGEIRTSESLLDFRRRRCAIDAHGNR